MKTENKKKTKKWIQPQHKYLIPVLRDIVKPLFCWLYGMKIEKFKEENALRCHGMKWMDL